MKLLLAVSVIVSLAIAVGGVWQLLSPPYSDAQIAASLVDTWEVHALTTSFALVLLSVLACITLAICMFSGKRLRLAACVAFFVISAGIGVQLAAHVVLTHQVARVTGQKFGPLYGLL